MVDAPDLADEVRRHVTNQQLDRSARDAHTVASTSRRRDALIRSCVRSTVPVTLLATLGH